MNHNSNGNSQSNSNMAHNPQQQQQRHGMSLGPGPPMQQQQQQRVTLGKCNLNELDGFSAPTPPPTAPPPPSATTATHTPQAPQQLLHHQQQQHHTGLGLALGLGMHSMDSVGMAMGAGHARSQCAYCCQPICDRYIMRVVDNSFHEGCLKCTACSLHLVHSCYARDGKLYCRIDYERWVALPQSYELTKPVPPSDSTYAIVALAAAIKSLPMSL